MGFESTRVILITGASSGLGAAVARELGACGHRLVLVARRGDLLEAVASDVRDRGGGALVVPADLSDADAPGRIVDETIHHHGHLDVLINNAGLGLPYYFGRSCPEDLRSQVAVNLTAPLILARHALPHLIASRGMVVNIGSAIACVPNPIFGVYGTTKAALAYWTEALRREVRHLGVRVCLVEPGPVETGFFEAVRRVRGGQAALGIATPTDRLYNPMRDRPPALLTIPVERAAQRIARLLEHPRRRLTLARRIIVPLRIAAALFRISPILGDLAISGMIRRVEREGRLSVEFSAGPPQFFEQARR
jgi:short-subunit dehydrogenase